MNDKTNRHHLERARDSIRLSETVQRQEARARLADDFQEGKLNMLLNREHKTGPVIKAGRIFLAGFLSVLLAGSAVAQNSRNVDVTAVSLEDLWNMQVTSVSKRTQKVADAAAAIFVLTQEDIRRSGATSIPEALRLVPGLEVARIDQNKWAIGSRGFNGRFDNKLLVLIDGRSVYTPLFSGVYWNVQDVMLEDVDRIEVIRGPGATLWGANAVDGVINVITKKAKATQSAIVTAGAGTEERAAGGVRFGSKLGDNTYYRAYTKYFDWGPSAYPTTGMTAHDGWDALRGGFRADWTPAGANSLTVQGDIYRSRFDETLTVASLSAPYSNTFPNDGKYSGGNILGRWNHTSEGSSMSLQMYYDNTTITDHSLFGDHQNILDLDFQHGFHVGDSQQFVWGLGYRSIRDKNDASFTVSLQPNQVTVNQFSTFLQDEISLVDNRLQITLGSKFERNEFTGFEIEPNARLLWNLTPNQSVWTAVSRAVRTPALTEEGLRLNSAVIPPGTPANPTPLPAVVAVFGSHRFNSEFNSEDLLAYELGYRVQATKNLSLDIATFYNNYSNLRTAEPGAPFPEGSPAPTDFVIPFVAGNKMSGGTYGVELFADWKVVPKWRLMGSYSYLQMDIHKNLDSQDPTPDNPNGSSPRHQWYLRSSVDLPKHFEQDTTLRFVDRLPSLNLPNYYSLDAHLGWKPVTSLELSIGGQNLLNNWHLEFMPDFVNTSPTVVKRSIFGSITVKF